MVSIVRIPLLENVFSPQPRVYRPGIYPNNMKLDSKTASFYQSRPSEHLDGRQAIVPCANILGGGSSINFMVSDAYLKFRSSATS
jgi:alcohol oxidase